MMLPTSRTGEPGFTLTELLVVMAIVSLVAAALPWALNSVSSSAAMQSATASIERELREARSRAREEGRVVSVDVRDISSPEGLFAVRARGISVNYVPQAQLDRRPERVVFYPDGTSTGGVITVASRGRKQEIAVSWLHSAITPGQRR